MGETVAKVLKVMRDSIERKIEAMVRETVEIMAEDVEKLIAKLRDLFSGGDIDE